MNHDFSLYVRRNEHSNKVKRMAIQLLGNMNNICKREAAQRKEKEEESEKKISEHTKCEYTDLLWLIQSTSYTKVYIVIYVDVFCMYI